MTVPKIPPKCSSPRSRDGAVDGLLGDDHTDADGDDDGRVTEREEKPDADWSSRPLHYRPFVEKLSRRVVDGGDVVGIEGMAKSEGVGEHAHADSQSLVMVGDHEGDEDTESDDVQGQNGAEHPSRVAPLARVQRTAELTDASRAANRRGSGELRYGHGDEPWCGRAVAGHPSVPGDERSPKSGRSPARWVMLPRCPNCDLLANHSYSGRWWPPLSWSNGQVPGR